MLRGPGKTIKVDLILSGPEIAFISGNHLNKEIFQKGPNLNPKSIMGIDVNRLSEHVITGSMDLEMAPILQPILEKWISLENVIKTLQQKRDTTRNWKRKHKLSTELRLAHLRRVRLRIELLTKARIQLGKKVLELNVDYVGIEAGLRKDTKDKKGALARAITSMPDNLALIRHEVMIINELFQRNVKIVLVRKEGTSKYHHQCGGIIDRTGDEGTCRECGERVNTHHNGANNVEDRASNLVHEWNATQKIGGTPSTC